MNTLFIGAGKGSWTMRGQQIGAVLGARAVSVPSPADFAWADVVVLVKRAGATYAQQARAAGKPIVWDALDCWSQPAQNQVSEHVARQILHNQIAVIKPALTIGATTAMADACGGVCLPHHSWSGLAPTAPRPAVQVVAYEGNALYLGRWKQWMTDACTARGWAFVVNPPDLSKADIIVGFRDREWDGWICREWKSGVKVVNAIAAGRPFISQPSAAVRELRPDGTIVESPEALSDALDYWSRHDARVAVVDRALEVAPAYTVDAIGARYRAVLTTVWERSRCAA
jgi:hypothetical protein